MRFPGRAISRHDDINRPPRSCDLTPLNFFLLGYARDRVYAHKPSTLEHLKTNIPHVMFDISLNMCQKVVENSLKCNTSLGDHLNDVVFHT